MWWLVLSLAFTSPRIQANNFSFSDQVRCLMILNYIGDLRVDFSGAGFQSEGYGSEIQWGNAV